MFDPARSGVYWLETASRPAAPPAEEIPARAPVAIVGGGATGVSAAYHLARAGVEAVLLERRAIGSGASGRNGGLFVTGWLRPFAAMSRRLGPQGARDLWELTRLGWDRVRALIREHAIDCDWREEGAVFAAEEEEDRALLEASAEQMASCGLPGEYLDPASLERATGSPLPAGTRGALFIPEAASFHPARLLYAVAEAARRAGARLLEGIEVQGIEVPRFGEARIATSAGVLEASVVILATNGWTAGLLPELAAQITGQREHVVASAPVPPRFRGAGWASEQVAYYWQQRPAGEIVIGGSHWNPWGDRRPQTDEDVVPDVAGDLAGYLSGRGAGVPVLALTHRWIGMMGITVDGMPLVGRLPGRAQLLISAGYNGHGNPLVYLCGKVLAEAIAGGRPSVEIPAFLSPGRFLE